MQHPGGPKLGEDPGGLEPQDLTAQRGDVVVEHFGGVLLDLGEDGGARGQPPAELANGGLGAIDAVGRSRRSGSPRPIPAARPACLPECGTAHRPSRGRRFAPQHGQ